jgi:hypothetical protein
MVTVEYRVQDRMYEEESTQGRARIQDRTCGGKAFAIVFYHALRRWGRFAKLRERGTLAVGFPISIRQV